MNVGGIEFVFLLLTASAAFFWIPTARLRQGFLALANACFLYTHVPDVTGWVALSIFIASGYLAASLLQSRPNRYLLTIYILVIVAAFLVLKRYDFLTCILPESVLRHNVVVVGISYMLFRQIHVLVDAMQGQIEGLSFWTYVNYQTNLFGLIAGPIQRYQDFQSEWMALEPLLTDSFDIMAAYRRVLIGVIKLSAVSVLCLAMYNRFSREFANNAQDAPLKSLLTFMLMFYVYPFYIYFNFSGYCDVVIGGASLFGIRMPENFDSPFLSRNMIEYWTRWHRTLGFWIRDYLFTPLYMSIATHWPQWAGSLAFLCYFVALFLTGVWHGSTWNFVIFGLLNGLGVSAAKLWENWIVKLYGRTGLLSYRQSRIIHVVAVILNFHFVCLTILFFPADAGHTVGMLNKVIRQIISY